MASYDEIMVALRNADKAGDTEAAKRLAAMAVEAKGAPGQGFGNNFAQQAGDGVFFGFGDEISARLNAITGYDASTGSYGNWGTTYADQLAAVREQERQFEAEHPVLAPVAEVGGALLTAAVPAGLAMRGGGGLLGRMGTAGLVGAGQGAAYGFGEGEGLGDRLDGAKWGGAFGGLLGGLAPAVGTVAQKLVEKAGAGRALRAAAKGAPSIDELRARANAIYAEADKVSNLPRAALADALAGTLDDAQRLGLDDMLHPSASRVASRLEDAAASEAPNVGFRELDILRRQAQVPAGNVANRSEQAIGSRMIEGIDDYMDQASPSLANALGEARDMWSRMRKAETLERIMETGDAYTSGKSSGIRNQVRSLLKSPKASRGYTAAEKAALTRVANPGPLESALHYAAGGLGQIATIGAGGAIGQVPGAAVGGVIGAAARKASEAITTRRTQLAQALIANGGKVALPTLTPTQQSLIEALYMAGIRQPSASLAEALR